MNKEFIPYEQALALKELGFDEPCLAWFSDRNIRIVGVNGCALSSLPVNSNFNGDNEFVTAPLYRQAFRWFREKYGLVHEISWSKYKGGLNFDYDVFSLVLPTDDELGDEDDVASDKSMETYDSLVNKDFRHRESDTYEEAEQACLDKLVQIVTGTTESRHTK